MDFFDATIENDKKYFCFLEYLHRRAGWSLCVGQLDTCGVVALATPTMCEPPSRERNYFQTILIPGKNSPC
ncbi:hypothetical protein [Burkholderia ubonensis]|uniref:hypothetical protein n=1 Tax=Burkholderia ubonensis TaxID=101571 RepID=UPI0012FB76D0|nr:hypothetical protein [Burkholderia ubonensis]